MSKDDPSSRDGRRPGQQRDRFFPIGYIMGQLRTTNKRHKRAIVARQARKEPVEKAETETSPEEKA